MIVKINCMWNDRGAWCKNKLIKRSLWGIGARCCIARPYGEGCSIRMPSLRPPPPPPPPPKRKIREDVTIRVKFGKEK